MNQKTQILHELNGFLPDGGFGFSVRLSDNSGDTLDDPRRSVALLLEDGAPLGPAHADHDEIRRKGEGRYSHWGDELIFSTSDNSDPNTNDRRYTLWLPPVSTWPLRYRPPVRREGGGNLGGEVRREQVLFEIDDFAPGRGHSFSVELPGSSGDNAQDLRGSLLQLLEDGVLLGPPHADHREIERTGQGRYAHWGETLYFSTSDNSDPRTNGRHYALWLPPGPAPLRYKAPAGDGARLRSLFEIDDFLPRHGHCFSVELPGSSGDNAQDLRGSLFQLLEDGVLLGPPHADHREIERTGQGRYAHWGETLYFSTSDNSDPRTNGRHYALWLPPGPAPLRYKAPAGDGARLRSLFEIDNFLPRHGHCFSVELPGSSGDNAQDLRGSLFQLLEDGILLGPPHADHREIEKTGQGRYVHWGETLYFSTSDNSDPRRNDRIYHVFFPVDIGQSSAATCAIEHIRALPADYTPAAAYRAIERSLLALDPTAILGDPHKRYWHDATFVADFRRLCGEDGRTMERKYTVYQLIKALYWLPGDIAECGTYNGGTAYFMALAGRDAGNERSFHLFDSFAGLSSPVEVDGEHWKIGELAVSQEQLQANLAGFSDIHVHPGWIPTQFHRVADRQFCFVHVDVDLHDPTRDSLDFFYPRLVPGGILLCDDYGSALCPGARRAMDDYFTDKPERIIDLPTEQGLIIKR